MDLTESTNQSGSRSEGRLARALEKQTARLPSDLFLWTGVGAILTSLTMRLMGRKNTGNFVATWVPTILLLGVYNKIVKVAGHDRQDQNVD
jgi:membrane protein implicated in regulation of membrane protease activity